MSLESNVCAACGHKLSREEIREQIGVPRRRGEARERRKWPLLVAAGVTLALAVTLVLIFVFAGGKKSSSPIQTVRDYYSAMSQSDLDTMALQFGAGYRPDLDERASISRALKSNAYRVTGPVLSLVSNDGQEARVMIESLRVSVIPGAGGVPHNHSVTDVLAPVHETDPNAFIVVKLSRQGDDWLIVNRPFGGWTPETFWLVGEPAIP